jgi:ABC-type microcin C transport system permease subunit YejB
MYVHVNALESFSNGQLDWANKLGSNLNKGKYRSTAKVLFRVVNQILNIVAGFSGAFIYQYFGPLALISVTTPLILCGLSGYLFGSRKYSDYWNKQMGKEYSRNV